MSLAAGVPVKITLQTIINQDGNEETFELIVFGRYSEKNNKSYLIYDEYHDHGRINTVVKYSAEGAQIIRKGALNMKLAFHPTEYMSGTYKTDIGTFVLGTVTNQYTFEWDDESKEGNIDIHYQFFMEQMDVGSYKLSFKFKEDKSK